MSESPKNSDHENDPLLAAWLREAAAGQPIKAGEHLASVRRTLLEKLETADSPASQRAGVSPGPKKRWPGLWSRHRLALGGVAASIALVGALLIALNASAPLSAMERVAKELKEVTSYSYRSAGWNQGLDDDGRLETRRNDSTVIWLAPNGLRQETTIVKIVEEVGGGNRTEEVLVRYDEVFPPGGRGVFIDHQYKTFCRHLYDPVGSDMYPWDFLRLIRDHSYDVLGDLGTKRIGETTAHGYRLTLKNQDRQAPENRIRDVVELWVDSQTDLPLEISWSGETEGWKYADLTDDFRWNVPLDKKRFEPETPPGYADITSPTEQRDLDQITAALRLFAQLSGHYPQEKKFNPRRIHDGMLRMVDSATPADPAAREARRKDIEAATPGLDWIAKILRNRGSSGYRGADVGPTDKDQALLWFADPASDGFRVFYGDLRTEVVKEEQKAKLIPKHEIVMVPQSE